MRKVFIDTSAWISYSLSKQPKHPTIKSLIKRLSKTGIIIHTSNNVIDETVTRLIYDTDLKITKRFINLINDGIKDSNIIELWVDEQIQSEAFEIVQKFFEHKLSLSLIHI